MASAVSFENIDEFWSYQAGYWEVPFAWAMDHYLDSQIGPVITKKLELCLLSFRADQRGDEDTGHALQFFVFDELPLQEQEHLLGAIRKTLADIQGADRDHLFWQEANFNHKRDFVEGTAEMVDYMERSYAKSLGDAGSS